jgi:hypothetical protein
VILDCGVLTGQTPLIYGSEGWGFESLRARQVSGPFPHRTGAFLVPLGATLGAMGEDEPPDRARVTDCTPQTPTRLFLSGVNLPMFLSGSVAELCPI